MKILKVVNESNSRQESKSEKKISKTKLEQLLLLTIARYQIDNRDQRKGRNYGHRRWPKQDE